MKTQLKWSPQLDDSCEMLVVGNRFVIHRRLGDLTGWYLTSYGFIRFAGLKLEATNPSDAKSEVFAMILEQIDGLRDAMLNLMVDADEDKIK